MNKSIKTLSILILMLLSAILLSAGMFMTVSFAQNNTSNTSVTMSGVSLRTITDENGKYGLKFKGVISNYDSNRTYGMDIVPADLKEDASKYAELTAEPTKDGDVYYYECALTDIFASNRSRPFTARPFVKDKDGTGKEYVGEWAAAKSIYTIATQALADQSYEYDTYIRTYLEEIIAMVHGTADDNINGKYIYKTLTIDGEDIDSFDKKFTGNVNFNTEITMVKDGDASKTITAYPIITLKNSDGEDITELLTQVDSRGNYKLSTSELSDFELSYSLAGEEIVSVTDCDITANKATYSQDGTVTLDGKQVGGVFSSDWCDGYDSAYVAIEGNYGIGTYIDIEFTGNNMPYVCFFADNINGNLGANGGQGVIFFNGVMSNDGDVDTSTGLPNEDAYWRGGQLIVYGPNRMSSSDYGRLAEMNCVVKGYESSMLNENIYRATQMGLRENPNTKYKMTIGTYDDSGILGIDFKLVEVETGVTVCRLRQPITRTTAGYEISTSNVSTGNIILYANLKQSVSSPNRFTTFKCSEPYQYQSNVIYSSGTSVNYNGSVTLQAGSHPTVSAMNGSIYGDGWRSGVSTFVNNYIGFEDAITVGKYIDFEFVGNNAPQVLLFADDITSSMGANKTGETSDVNQNGYLITTGLYDITTDPDSIYGENKFSISGPNRVHVSPSTIPVMTTISGAFNGFEEDVNYKYTVGSQVQGGKVIIVADLYNIDENKLVCRLIYNTEMTEENVKKLGSDLVAYAGVKGNSLTTTFKYGEVYEKTVSIPVSQGATMNADGTVTLAPGTHVNVSAEKNGSVYSDGWASGISAFKNNYIAFEDASKVGQYIDFYFTGNNMPQVTMFAGEINTCVGGSTTANSNSIDNTGYYISNGMYVASTQTTLGEGLMFVYGENRVCNNPRPAEVTASNLDVVQGAYTGLTEGTDYKYTVGSKVVGETVVIEVMLYTVDGANETLVYSATYDTEKTVTEVVETVGSHIIAYAGIKGSNLTTTFSYSDVYKI